MQEHSKRPNRRFRTGELLAHVFLCAVAFGAVNIGSRIDNMGSHGPFIEAFLTVFGLATLVLMGSLLGVAIALILGGRRCVPSGAIVGGVCVPLLLFVCAIVVVYRTHNRHRMVIIRPQGQQSEVELSDSAPQR